MVYSTCVDVMVCRRYGVWTMGFAAVAIMWCTVCRRYGLMVWRRYGVQCVDVLDRCGDDTM